MFTLCYTVLHRRLKKVSTLTLRKQLAAARGHHGALFGGLTMRTGRQLDVIAAVTVHKQLGQKNRRNVYTSTHMSKQTSVSPNRRLYTNPTSTYTSDLSVYVLSCTDKCPLVQETGQECPRCKLAHVYAQESCQKL